MRADGMTFHSRCISDSVETEDLGGTERTECGPHKFEVGVETTAVSATRLLSELSLFPVVCGP